ncbi:MAG: fatty acyl-AMP ligase [Myxococcota bacterium]|nr:fatty acyl-AMP ligase [Myxococcota bacterium]MDW8362752.1 fatty acyl-AMP ligase [Myxococcales bacterium]
MQALESARTLVEALERVAERSGRGFRFVGVDGVERFYTYAEMWRIAQERAAHLLAAGLRRGDRLALVIGENDQFVLSFLGATVAGIVPVPVFPRGAFKALDGYLDVLAHVCRAARARAMLVTESSRSFAERVLERDCGLERILRCETLFAGPAPSAPRVPVEPEDLCFLQFTSGSTSRPKGVQVRHRNLVANARAFLGPHGLDRRDDDVGVSWLPLHHDMGLIGFVLGTLVCDIPVVLLPTESFGRRPRLWLETIHRHRGTITYAPNFAYDLVTRRLKPADVASLDLSCLRVAGCGAEPIRARTLQAFADALRPAGFDGDRALLPSYGMAEATLAITFHRLGTPMRVDRVDAAALRAGRAVPAGPDAQAVELVGCGVPFPDHELRIVDEAGRTLPERVVGEIVTRGPSVTSGYFENEEATRESWREGWLHTGDLGYVADGELFVCGRIKDLIIVRGANYHPQDIEWAVSDLEGVRRGNVVAFSTMVDGFESLVVAAEAASSDAPELRRRIAQLVQERFGLVPSHVAIVPVGTLPKTSSGKAQRRRTRMLFEERALAEHP